MQGVLCTVPICTAEARWSISRQQDQIAAPQQQPCYQCQGICMSDMAYTPLDFQGFIEDLIFESPPAAFQLKHIVASDQGHMLQLEP